MRPSQSRMDPVKADVEGSAIDDDGLEAFSPHSFSGRGAQSIPAQARGARRRDNKLIDIDDDTHDDDTLSRSHRSAQDTHTPSRRASLAQDDVWFPLHQPAGDAEADGEEIHEKYHQDHSEGLPSHLPPGFPFTFDMGALEEYTKQEKSRAEEEMASNSTSAWGMRRRGATPINRAAKSQGDSTENYGASPTSDDATFYSRRPRKYMDVPGIEPEGKNGHRYQRKLALFEGAGPSPPVGARSATATTGGILGGGPLMEQERNRERQRAMNKNGFPADTKTPLLEDHDVPSYQGADWEHPEEPPLARSVSMGADLSNLVKRAKGSSRPMRGARTSSFGGSEKAYRFTFYSNALANTIHARHLFELPAAGQTFEELFLGIDPQQKHKDVPGDNGKQANHEPSNEQDVAAPHASAHASVEQTRLSTLGLRPASGVANALHAGRLEGSTAPNTGANTPEHAPNMSASRLATLKSGAPSARPSQAATPTTAQVSALDKTRTLPGGGLRVDTDPETCTWWLDVLCPTDQEMKMLSRVFGIHPLTTEDILMEETREKIELFRNYYLVCFRSFDQDPYSPTYLEPLNMYVIVFREGTLSFHFRATPHPQNVRRRIKQLKDYINVTSDWISYALIDDITDAFGPLIQSIEYEVDSIDELVLILKEAEQSDMLRRIGTCRKKVMGLLRLMGNKADVVKGLAKRCNENWSVAPKSDIGLYLSDIQDHLITMTQNLNHYEKILSRSHSNYLAQISIEMTDANNQINDVLSKLTALGTVIVPLNVITGLWGMNVHVPGEDVENLRWFFGIIAVMVALAGMWTMNVWTMNVWTISNLLSSLRLLCHHSLPESLDVPMYPYTRSRELDIVYLNHVPKRTRQEGHSYCHNVYCFPSNASNASFDCLRFMTRSVCRSDCLLGVMCR